MGMEVEIIVYEFPNHHRGLPNSRDRLEQIGTGWRFVNRGWKEIISRSPRRKREEILNINYSLLIALY